LLGFSICNKFASKLNYIEILIGREPEIENNEKKPKTKFDKKCELQISVDCFVFQGYLLGVS